MKHLKRHAVPKSWPITRKGTTFVVKPNANLEKGLPILVILRDMLKIAQSRREVKKALHAKNVLINGKYIKEDQNSATLFDVVTIVPSKQNYRIGLAVNGRFKIEEVKESESGHKICKIVNRKILNGKKPQLNLSDGRNIISDIKCNMGDSAVMDFKSKKISKCLPLKEKSKVIIFIGKHTGKEGEIESIDKNRKMAVVNSNSEKINVLLEQLMVIE